MHHKSKQGAVARIDSAHRIPAGPGLPSERAGLIVEQQKGGMEVIREVGLVLNPKVGLDRCPIVSAQLEGMRAESSAFEVARLIGEDTDENELSVAVFDRGLRTPLHQNQRDQLRA